MMQEKPGMMKVCDVFLVFIKFLMCILGTFLTRTGVVSMVHCFPRSGIGGGGTVFNKVNIPIGLVLLFLTGVGALLAGRKTAAERLKRNFGWPLAIGLVAGVIALLFGFRQIYSWICLILCVFVASTVGLEFYRGAKVIRARSGASFAASAVELTMRNTRRYGGYIVHVGMGVGFF